MNGGFRIRKLHVSNWALLGKWLWRYALGYNYLWRKNNLGQIWKGGDGWWCTLEVTEAFSMRLWKAIRKGWEKFSLRNSILVRNGLSTKFSLDRSVGELALKELFPQMFMIDSNRNATVPHFWVAMEEESSRSLPFRRYFQSWEFEVVMHGVRSKPLLFLWGEDDWSPTSIAFVNSVRNWQTTFSSIVIEPESCRTC